MNLSSEKLAGSPSDSDNPAQNTSQTHNITSNTSEHMEWLENEDLDEEWIPETDLPPVNNDGDSSHGAETTKATASGSSASTDIIPAHANNVLLLSPGSNAGGTVTSKNFGTVINGNEAYRTFTSSSVSGTVIEGGGRGGIPAVAGSTNSATGNDYSTTKLLNKKNNQNENKIPQWKRAIERKNAILGQKQGNHHSIQNLFNPPTVDQHAQRASSIYQQAYQQELSGDADKSMSSSAAEEDSYEDSEDVSESQDEKTTARSRAVSSNTTTTDGSAKSRLKLFRRHDTFTNQRLGHLLSSMNTINDPGEKENQEESYEEQLEEEEDSGSLHKEFDTTEAQQPRQLNFGTSSTGFGPQNSVDRRELTTQDFFQNATEMMDFIRQSAEPPYAEYPEGSVVMEEEAEYTTSSYASETELSSQIVSKLDVDTAHGSFNATSTPNGPSSEQEEEQQQQPPASPSRYPSVIVHSQTGTANLSLPPIDLIQEALQRPNTSSSPVSRDDSSAAPSPERNARRNMGVILRTDEVAMAIPKMLGSMKYDPNAQAWFNIHNDKSAARDPSKPKSSGQGAPRHLHKDAAAPATTNPDTQNFNSFSSEDVFSGIEDLESFGGTHKQASAALPGRRSGHSTATSNHTTSSSINSFATSNAKTTTDATSITSGSANSDILAGELKNQVSNGHALQRQYPSHIPVHSGHYRPLPAIPHQKPAEVTPLRNNSLAPTFVEAGNTTSTFISEMDEDERNASFDEDDMDKNFSIMKTAERAKASDKLRRIFDRTAMHRSHEEEVSSKNLRIPHDIPEEDESRGADEADDTFQAQKDAPREHVKNKILPTPNSKQSHADTPSNFSISSVGTPRNTTRVSMIGDLSYRHTKSKLVQVLTDRYQPTSSTENPDKVLADNSAYDLVGRPSAGVVAWDTLTHVNLSGSGLDSIMDLGVICPRLYELNVSHNRLATMLGVPASVRALNVSHNRLTRLATIGGLRALALVRYLDISHNPEIDTLVGLAHLTQLTELNAEGCGIRSLSIFAHDAVPGSKKNTGAGFAADLVELQVLKLNKNRLRGVVDLQHGAGFGRRSRLAALDLRDNQITDVWNVAVLPRLHSLDLDNNLLTSLRFVTTEPVAPKGDGGQQQATAAGKSGGPREIKSLLRLSVRNNLLGQDSAGGSMKRSKAESSDRFRFDLVPSLRVLYLEYNAGITLGDVVVGFARGRQVQQQAAGPKRAPLETLSVHFAGMQDLAGCAVSMADGSSSSNGPLHGSAALARDWAQLTFLSEIVDLRLLPWPKPRDNNSGTVPPPSLPRSIFPSYFAALRTLELPGQGLTVLTPAFAELVPNLRVANFALNALGDAALVDVFGARMPLLQRLFLYGNRVRSVAAVAAFLAARRGGGEGGRAGVAAGALEIVDLRGNPVTADMYPDVVQAMRAADGEDGDGESGGGGAVAAQGVLSSADGARDEVLRSMQRAFSGETKPAATTSSSANSAGTSTGRSAAKVYEDALSARGQDAWRAADAAFLEHLSASGNAAAAARARAVYWAAVVTESPGTVKWVDGHALTSALCGRVLRAAEQLGAVA